jgi:hypothetical protein
MRRVITIAAACLALAGCSGAPRPPMMELGIESTPPGANAVTSLGPGCTTPCTVTLPMPSGDFTVNYTLNEYQPATVAVRVFGNPAGLGSPGTTRLDPDPVVAQLQPIAPPPPPPRVRKKPPPKKPPPAAQ